MVYTSSGEDWEAGNQQVNLYLGTIDKMGL